MKYLNFCWEIHFSWLIFAILVSFLGSCMSGIVFGVAYYFDSALLSTSVHVVPTWCRSFILLLVMAGWYWLFKSRVQTIVGIRLWFRLCPSVWSKLIEVRFWMKCFWYAYLPWTAPSCVNFPSMFSKLYLKYVHWCKLLPCFDIIFRYHCIYNCLIKDIAHIMLLYTSASVKYIKERK